LKFQWEHAHADKVAAVDAFVAFRDDCAHAEQPCAFCAQSREEPEPYSFSGETTSGTQLLDISRRRRRWTFSRPPEEKCPATFGARASWLRRRMFANVPRIHTS